MMAASWLLLIVLSAAPAHAAGTEVRFVHAVAGVGPASLSIDPAARGRPLALGASFARPTAYRAVRAGRARLELALAGSAAPAAARTVTLRGGRHTVIAVARRPGNVSLFLYRDDGMRAGKASIRAIHAAGEVGAADVRVDGRVVARGLGLGEATGYLPLDSGSYDISVTRPGGGGGALVSRDAVALVAGTTSTAIVLGSGGVPAQIVLASDAAAGPSVAPGTGFGASPGFGGWLVVLAAALVAGSLGGGLHTAVASRRRDTRPRSPGPGTHGS